MSNQQPSPKILAQKIVKTGKLILIKVGNDKPKWVWERQVKKVDTDTFNEFLSR